MGPKESLKLGLLLGQLLSLMSGRGLHTEGGFPACSQIDGPWHHSGLLTWTCPFLSIDFTPISPRRLNSLLCYVHTLKNNLYPRPSNSHIQVSASFRVVWLHARTLARVLANRSSAVLITVPQECQLWVCPLSSSVNF